MSEEVPTPGQPERHDPYAALRVHNYQIFIIGWFIATIGTRIQSVAISWEMYERTGDALSLGLVGLAQALPAMLLALPAGYLADRFDRPKLVILSLSAMTITSLCLAILSFSGGSTAFMYMFLFIDAAAVMIGRPARVALVPQLVPSEIFPNAVTWNMSLMQVAAVFGPALGGLVVALNVSAAYVVTAASSLFFIAILSRFKFDADEKQVGEASLGSPLGALLAGIKFVWNARIILTMMTLDLFAVLLGGAVYLLPIYAKDILDVGATGFGWLRAAPAIGAFCMAILMVYLPPMKHAGRAMLLSIAGFGVATIIFGLSRSFWLSFAMLFLTGTFDNVSMVVRGTLQQLLTPNHMRGRVSAVSSVFIGASNELGGLESGVVAHWLGPVVSVVAGGIGTLAVVGIAAVASPELRNFGEMSEAKPIQVDTDGKPSENQQRYPVPAAGPADD